MNWLQLDQRICIVTGGGKGLGAGIMQALLASGCRVVVLDHDSDALAQLAATHPDARRLLPIRADVSSPAAVEAAFQTLQQHWGAGPSVLVNNAAITSAAPLAELDPAVWERQLQINLGGYLRMGQAFHRHSDASLPRAIINIASISAQNAQPLSGGYSMSKAGIRMLTAQMCLEWGPEGIRCNTVSPGLFVTPLSERFYRNPDDRARREQVVPLRRIGQIDELAHAVVFLASPRASYIHGADLVVDGGFSHSLMTHIPRAYGQGEWSAGKAQPGLEQATSPGVSNR